MVATILEALNYAFFQRALLGGMLTAVATGMLGVFVVQRGLAYLGNGLAHASFGGLALGALVASLTSAQGVLREPLWIALPFTIVVAVSIAYVRDRTRLSSDTAIGVFFAVSVALGILFLSLIPPDENVIDVWHLLFGSILAVGPRELVFIAVMAAVTVAVLTATWGRLAYATFDEELAQSDGVRVRRLEYGLFILAAVAVVVSAQVVGIILLAAYLIIPAASARLLSISLLQMTALSVGIGVVTTVVGLLVSYLADVPSGATIVLLQAALFAATALLSRRH